MPLPASGKGLEFRMPLPASGKDLEGPKFLKRMPNSESPFKMTSVKEEDFWVEIKKKLVFSIF